MITEIRFFREAGSGGAMALPVRPGRAAEAATVKKKRSPEGDLAHFKKGG